MVKNESLEIQRREVLRIIREEEITDLLRELVQIPSRNPPGEEREAIELIVKKMKKWGFEVELVYEPFLHRPQAISTYKGDEGKPKLILNGHIDTVPEGDIRQWSIDPFTGEIRDGRLYGRGSCDMKGGLTAMMIAAKAIKDLEINLRGDLLLQFVVGEETGEPGTKTLLIDKGLTGDWGIVLEPTNLKVATAEKGLVWFNVTIKGVQAHASTPHLGINAIEKCTDFILSLRKYRERIMKRRHPLVGMALCTVTMIDAGIKENIIPESCRLFLDRRILPYESVDAVEEEIREILSQIEVKDPKFNWEIRKQMVYEAAEIPINSKIARVLRRNVKEITGETSEPYGTAFSTDVRNFINDAKMFAVSWGPGNPAVAHTSDEYIDIKQVVDGARILALTIIDLLV